MNSNISNYMNNGVIGATAWSYEWIWMKDEPQVGQQPEVFLMLTWIMSYALQAFTQK